LYTLGTYLEVPRYMPRYRDPLTTGAGSLLPKACFVISGDVCVNGAGVGLQFECAEVIHCGIINNNLDSALNSPVEDESHGRTNPPSRAVVRTSLSGRPEPAVENELVLR
jgi:hypothetical protein